MGVRLNSSEPVTRTQRSQGTFGRIHGAIVDLLDEAGIEAVTFRAIAARAGFSLGTVSYHLAPLGDLRHHLWQYVEVDMVSHTFGVTRSHDAAIAVLDWAERYPQRASFYCNHTPDPDRPLRRDVIDRLPIAPSDVATLERFRPTMRYIARRLQCVVEYAIGEPDRPAAIEELRLEMKNQHRLWAAMVERAAAES